VKLTQYYYLVASLPLLSFEAPPPFNGPDWLALCRQQVSADDLALLARISFGAPNPRPGDHPVWLAYASWETALRNELALQRALRLGIDPAPFFRDAPFYYGLSAQVKEMLGAGTPKAVETALDRRRWSCLEELESAQFDLGRLVVYRLKLLLLERRSQFLNQPGVESFMSKYGRVLDQTAEWARAAGHAAQTDTE
jgi:hypothetical protein